MAGQRFLFRPVLPFHKALNWPMHKCITLFCRVRLSPPFVFFPYLVPNLSTFLSIPPLAFLSLSLALCPTVSIQWMEQRFLVFSLLSRTALSDLKWKRGCKSERSHPSHVKITVKKTKNHKRSANDHTRRDIKRLQVQALGSLSGRQEIRGLLLVVVFNQALLDWFWWLVVGVTSDKKVTNLNGKITHS